MRIKEASKMIKQLSLFILTMILAVSAALADRERVDETRDAKSDGFVRITVVRGEIKVEGWDRDAIRVRGQLDSQTEEFVFDVKGDDAFIEVKLPRSINSWCCDSGSDLTIEVPEGSHVDISAVSTDIVVDDISGALEISGVSGDIRASQISERVDITTVSGEVDLRDARGRIELKSVSGDVEAFDLEGDIRLHSVSGDINGRNIGAELDLESVSGNIDVVQSKFVSLRGHTVSGDVDIVGELQNGGTLEFDSVSGGVRLRFKGSVNARFDVETGSGSIRNRITNDKPIASKYVRDETLRFVAGDGTAEVIVGTRSGDILLSRD